jgi:hypothetical protein
MNVCESKCSEKYLELRRMKNSGHCLTINYMTQAYKIHTVDLLEK